MTEVRTEISDDREEPMAVQDLGDSEESPPEPNDAAEAEGENDESPLEGDRLRSVLESLIFVSDRPVTPGRLARAVRCRLAEIRPVLEQLQEHYRERGIELVEVGGGLQFRSAAENSRYVRGLLQSRAVRLSRAQLEVLAITAYRQPVTRPEMDEIRGVDCGSALKVLLDRNLIRILGRKEEPGRPLLYGTTPQFLEFFGLRGLQDLPTLKEFSELSDESRALFERKMGTPFSVNSLDETSDEATAEGHTSEEDTADEHLGAERSDHDEEDAEHEDHHLDHDDGSSADTDGDLDDFDEDEDDEEDENDGAAETYEDAEDHEDDDDDLNDESERHRDFDEDEDDEEDEDFDEDEDDEDE